MVAQQELIRNLSLLVGSDKVTADKSSLETKCRDTWVLSLWRKLNGRDHPLPTCVVTPTSTEEVAKVLRYATANEVRVIPAGGRSGVCGGVLAGAGTIVIDMGAMNRLIEVDEIALTATAEAGMLGKDYEAALRERGFSTGHFPQSIDCSSVGGWVATRAAGQFSTKYGCIEDLLMGLRAVLPGGEVIDTSCAPRSSTGPDLKQLFLGSEGSLGIITQVTYRIHPLPQASQLRSYSFPSMSNGFETLRLLMREGWKPAVLRLYDETETARHFHGQTEEGRCLLIAICEGARAMVAAEGDALEQICTSQGGKPCGRAPAQKWLEERNVVPSFESFLNQGIIVDTIEIAALWGRIEKIYDAVLSRMRKVPGLIVVSGHSSHSYCQGTNIYFSFAASAPPDSNLEQVYTKCWEAAMETTLELGGTISHHHGIGRVRTPWLAGELKSSYHLLQLIKQALDPGSVMNPGVLIAERG